MPNSKPIGYSPTIRPQDTERAQETVTAAFFPNEQQPWAIDFTGTCPRCGDRFSYRQWLIAVVGALKMNDRQMEALASHLDTLGVDRSHGDESFDLTCTCEEEHPHRPSDKRGCGAVFQMHVSWP